MLKRFIQIKYFTTIKYVLVLLQKVNKGNFVIPNYKAITYMYDIL